MYCVWYFLRLSHTPPFNWFFKWMNNVCTKHQYCNEADAITVTVLLHLHTACLQMAMDFCRWRRFCCCCFIVHVCSCYLWTEWSSIVRRYWKNTFTVFIFVWILTHIVLQLFVSFKKAMWWDAQLPMLWVDTFDILTYKSINARSESISKLTCNIVIRSNLLSTHMRYQFWVQ